MGVDGRIYIREIVDKKGWELLRHDFYEYVNRHGDYIQVYEYKDFLGKHVILVYRGDSPTSYGDDFYLVFPELSSRVGWEEDDLKALGYEGEKLTQKLYEELPWYAEWKEKFERLFGEPYEFEVWT